jgi:hypothetical protein
MMKNVSPRVERIIRALSETIKPRKPGFDPPIEEDILKVGDLFLGALPSHMKVLMPLGLYMLEFATFIFCFPTIRPFSSLSPEKREKYILGWMESKAALRRDLIKGFKAIVMTGYYAHPIVMDHLGYDLEAHLKRVNVGDIDSPPPVPCSKEAAEYFSAMEKDCKWDTSDRLPGSCKRYFGLQEDK